MIERRGEATFGLLPIIGDLEESPTGFESPLILTEDEPNSKRVRDLIFNPDTYPLGISSGRQVTAADYKTLHGGHAKIWWRPRNFSVTEDLQDITSILRTQQIDYMTPPGHISGESYVWHARDDLQASFKSTDPVTAAKQSDHAFISGIFLGIAGAAVIALIQEIPGSFMDTGWWASRKRKRKLPTRA